MKVSFLTFQKPPLIFLYSLWRHFRYFLKIKKVLLVFKKKLRATSAGVFLLSVYAGRVRKIKICIIDKQNIKKIIDL